MYASGFHKPGITERMVSSARCVASATNTSVPRTVTCHVCAPTGEPLAGTDDFPVGGGAIVVTASGPVVITHPTDTEFLAFDGRCPHAGCPVAEVNEKLDFQKSLLYVFGFVQKDDKLSSKEIQELYGEKIVELHGEVDVYRAQVEGESVYAFTVQSPGLWGTITGFDPYQISLLRRASSHLRCVADSWPMCFSIHSISAVKIASFSAFVSWKSARASAPQCINS